MTDKAYEDAISKRCVDAVLNLMRHSQDKRVREVAVLLALRMYDDKIRSGIAIVITTMEYYDRCDTDVARIDALQRLLPIKDRIRCRSEGSRYSRNRRLVNAYGITLDRFDALLKDQGGVCGCCRKPRISAKDWCVDHCHVTGEVRGILCSPCNSGIGMLGDTIDGVQRAASYLNKHELRKRLREALGITVAPRNTTI